MKEGDDQPAVRLKPALICAIEGKKPEVYKWLQEAIDKGWTEYRLALLDPMLGNLQPDQQFQQMMAQAKEAVDKMEANARESEK